MLDYYRLIELRYLVLEYEITPPDYRPLTARVNYPKCQIEYRNGSTQDVAP